MVILIIKAGHPEHAQRKGGRRTVTRNTDTTQKLTEEGLQIFTFQLWGIGRHRGEKHHEEPER